MPFKFNPFSGNFDQTGSGGGGASYIDGEVAVYADLPLDGTAPLNTAWLVREASGIWPVSRKQAGIYIRTATAGSSRDADYTYAGTMPDVFSDAVFTLYDDASTTRTGQFNLGNITAGQNRVLTWPDGNGTIARTSDIPSTFAASAITSGVFDNARINFAAADAIGSTTPSTGAFTTLSASTSLTLGTSGILSGGTNTIEQRNTTSAQTFRIYNTVSGAADANFERGFLRWSSNVLQIGTEKGGTGSARALEFQTDGTTRLTLASTGNAVFAQASVVGATWYFGHQNRSIFKSPSDGVLTLMNWAETDLGRLQFGGTTSSFPALKRSSTALQVRLADDSAFAPLISSQIGIGVASPERPLHIQASDAMGRIDRVGSNGPALLMVRMATLGSVSSSWLFGPATGFASVANDDFSIIDFGSTTSGTSGTQRLTIAKSDGQLTVNGNLNLSTKNLVTDTTTGTKIGTATTQKLGFFNATPVVQQAAIADATDAATTQARLNDLLAAMRSLGLIAT